MSLHVYAIYVCTFFCFCTFFCQCMCITFLLWAASYDGLMPSLAACHCSTSCVLSMLCTRKIRALSLLTYLLTYALLRPSPAYQVNSALHPSGVA